MAYGEKYRAFALSIMISMVLSAAVSDPCGDPVGQKSWDSSPVYAEATELARSLESQGIDVQCIRRSKEEHLFEGQKGAAWFKTTDGVFEVWFLPKSERFNDLEISEQPAGNGRYIYSFRGLPHVPPTMDSSQPISFIKHGNILFEVWGDRGLAAKLRGVIGKL